MNSSSTTKGVRWYIFSTEEDLGMTAAELIAVGIADTGIRQSNFVLGCPAGRSPRSTYRALAERAALDGLPQVSIGERLAEVDIAYCRCEARIERENGDWRTPLRLHDHLRRRLVNLGARKTAGRGDASSYSRPRLIETIGECLRYCRDRSF